MQFYKDHNDYTAQVKAAWGDTQPYREFEEKTAQQSQQELQATGNALMDIFAEMGAIRHLSPASKEAQVLVGKLQAFITEHYYTCTKPILQGLGEMYIAGDSMTENIDGAGGKGTAQFAHDAIAVFCNSSHR